MNLIYSYVPFLNNPGLIEETDVIKAENIVRNQPKATGSYCCWSMKDNIPLAVLVFNNAKKIYDDIMNFSKNRPEFYFNLEFDYNDSGYAIGLIPNFELCFKQTNQLRMMQGKEPLVRKDTEVLYTPIHFHARNLEFLKRVKISDRITFAIMDVEDLQKSTTEIDFEKIHIVGEFNISQKNYHTDYILKKLSSTASQSAVN